MEGAALLRMLASLSAVLALLSFALWAVRRAQRRWPALAAGLGTGGLFAGRAAAGRMQLVERLAIDKRHRLLLVRLDTRELLLLDGPRGIEALDGTARGGEPARSMDAALAAPPAPRFGLFLTPGRAHG